MKTRNNLNVPGYFIKHMISDDNYGYENLRLQMTDKGFFTLFGDEDGGKKNTAIIRYSYNDGWITSLHTPIMKETLDLFVDLCKVYYDLGDNIIVLTEYGIMEDQ